MTYVLIFILFAGTGNNIAASGSAEFNSLDACQRAAAAIESQINPLRYIRVVASCHEKGSRND